MAQFYMSNSFQRENDFKKILAVLSGFTLFCLCIGLTFLLTGPRTEVAHAITENISKGSIEILMPVQDIPANTPLRQEFFRIEKVNREVVQSGVITSFESVTNKFSRTLIVANRPLYSEYIISLAPNDDIRDRIPDGFRAVTIKVDKLTSFEGWLKPGARVDISSFTTMNAEQVLTPVVHNILVLSVEKKTDPTKLNDQGIPETITLVANPTEASRIQYAQQTGMLTLFLRGTIDKGAVGEKTVIGKKDFNPNFVETKPQEKYAGTITIDGTEFFIDDRGKIINPESKN